MTKMIVSPVGILIVSAIVSVVVSILPGSTITLGVISGLLTTNIGVVYLLYEQSISTTKKAQDLLEVIRGELTLLADIAKMEDDFIKDHLRKIADLYQAIKANPKRPFFASAVDDNLIHAVEILESLAHGELTGISLELSARWVGWCFDTVDQEIHALDTQDMDHFWPTPVGTDYRIDNKNLMIRDIPIHRIFIMHSVDELKKSKGEIEQQAAEGVQCYVAFADRIAKHDDSNICIYVCCTYPTWVSWVSPDYSGRPATWNVSIHEEKVRDLGRQYDRVRSVAMEWHHTDIQQLLG